MRTRDTDHCHHASLHTPLSSAFQNKSERSHLGTKQTSLVRWINSKSLFWPDSQAEGRKCLGLSLAPHKHCLSEAEGPLAPSSLTWPSQSTHCVGTFPSSPCHAHFKSPFFSSCTRNILNSLDDHKMQ